MQVILLAGGTGTRLKEMTDFLPKAMIPIGGKPIIYHIMNHYAKYGHYEFIVALGDKQEAFKQYFGLFHMMTSDICCEYSKTTIINPTCSRWKITASDTGLNTLKGGRIKRIEKYIEKDTFMLTYGDALSDVDIGALIKFHRSHGRLVTVTGVTPKPRFGELLHMDGRVVSFKEKPSNGLVNGGFMVLNRGVFDYLDEDCDFEIGPLEEIAKNGQLMVYQHDGYWGCCDTLSDMIELQKEWEERGCDV